MQTLTIIRPDDMHLHLRDGDALKAVAPYTARQMGRAVIMPNLKTASRQRSRRACLQSAHYGGVARRQRV